MNKLTEIWTPFSSPLLPSLPHTYRHHHLLCWLAAPPPLTATSSSIAPLNAMTQVDRWIPMEQRVSNGWAKRLFSSSQPMARDAISGQSVCLACFLYLTTVLPCRWHSTAPLPSWGFSETGGSVRPTMAFPSVSSVLWSVSLLTVLFAAAVHSNILYGECISPNLSI